MELEIQSRNVAMTPRWKTEIEARMDDLRRGHDDLIHGRVTLIKNRHHKKLANVAEALVVVTLPGRHTLTARKEDKTFEEAIRSAFQAISIELRKYREKRAKTDVRLPPVPPHRGVICKLFPKERYGFILKEGGGEVYFHANALQGLTFRKLEDGTEVVFGLEQGDKGPQATVVTLLPPIAKVL
ncbi:MAG: cold shock domain-containing protein [Nitrospira sp.]|nr:cold shock domain-containing protein [Nitrospira sp.]MDH4344072.1 cold shock domain-containing protein [Nitrospira sp.]MDH5337374.1 cold shock domain-containing protein [Nitrospira sp.]